MKQMERSIKCNLVKDESDLLRFDVKKNLAQLLNVSEENLFPLPEDKEISIYMSFTIVSDL